MRGLSGSGGLYCVSRMPNGPNTRACTNWSSAWPVRRSMMNCMSTMFQSVYSTAEPGSRTSGNVTMPAKYCSRPFASFHSG